MIDWKSLLKIEEDEIDRGLKLYKEAISFDTLYGIDHEILTMEMIKKANYMIDKKASFMEINKTLRNMRLDGIVKNNEIRKEYTRIWEDFGPTAASYTIMSDTLNIAMSNVAEFDYKIDSLRDLFIKATRAEDILRAKKDGKHAIVYNIQNTTMLGGGSDIEIELDKIDLFYHLGVRVWQLTYNLRNFVGDGCTERYGSGLTYFGERVVERMNDLNILIDVSHCGKKTTLDTVEKSSSPVAATHTGCKGIYDHARSKTDEELVAIAESGGYIGIYMVPTFIAYDGTINDWLDHVDYAAKLVGTDHIGIGTDNWYRSLEYPKQILEMWDNEANFWNGFRPEHRLSFLTYPPSIEKDIAWANWPYYAVALVSRGYSDQEVKGILGENFLRLFKNVVG